MIDHCPHKARRPFCPWYYNVSGSHACASPSPTCPDFVCLNALLYERQQAAGTTATTRSRTGRTIARPR